MSERRRTSERDGSDLSSLPKTSDQLSLLYFSRLVCLPLFICSQDFDGNLQVKEMEELIGGQELTLSSVTYKCCSVKVISGPEIANAVSRASVDKPPTTG